MTAVRNLSLRRRRKVAKPKLMRRGSRATREKRMLDKIDRLSVKIVTLVSSKVDREGVLEAYEGIEAAREVRGLITELFANFNRAR